MSLILSPCSHCNAPNPIVSKKSGRAGRISKTPFYRETITCRQCKISVTAGTPGNAAAFWNRSASNKRKMDELTEESHELVVRQYEVAAKDAEIERLREDYQDLLDAIQPLLGCAYYASENDLSGHERLIVTASEAREAANALARINARSALKQEASTNG